MNTFLKYDAIVLNNNSLSQKWSLNIISSNSTASVNNNVASASNSNVFTNNNNFFTSADNFNFEEKNISSAKDENQKHEVLLLKKKSVVKSEENLRELNQFFETVKYLKENKKLIKKELTEKDLNHSEEVKTTVSEILKKEIEKMSDSLKELRVLITQNNELTVVQSSSYEENDTNVKDINKLLTELKNVKQKLCKTQISVTTQYISLFEEVKTAVNNSALSLKRIKSL